MRLDSLTGLRFYAALIVVLFHTAKYLEPAGPASKVVGLGYTGVSFFFVLSGFVLAWSRKPGLPNSQFYWRRFARVWPLHALTTIFAMVTALFITGATINWAALPAVLTLTQGWFPAGDIRYAFNGVSWSLSCEMFFYLVFPFAFQALRFLRPARVMVITAVSMVGVAGICVLVFPTSQLGYLLYTLPAFRLGEFIIGICLATLIKNGWTPKFTLSHALLFSAGLYAMIMLATDVALKDPERMPYVVADLWMLPGFAAIIAAAASRDIRATGGHFAARPIVKLGEWSFALYLVHELFILSAAPAINRLPNVAGILASGVVLIAAVLGSAALHEWFERPVEKQIRHWAGRGAVRPSRGRRAFVR
ncbi:acyltransferase family protein [Paenarthrobacter nicotinovorans]|uniref:acyltransferase family protein n=1 Tax=Paenarthrobacter nicotinovorans TaxID=29320 RepID=UPI00166AE06C|nr:acyltransferase [Paenarthrobacter nicotinovorans]